MKLPPGSADSTVFWIIHGRVDTEPQNTLFCQRKEGTAQ